MKTKNKLISGLIMTLAIVCGLQFLAVSKAHAIVSPRPEPRPDLIILAAVYKAPEVAVRLRNAGDAGAPASTLAVLLLKKTDPDTNLPVAFQFPIPALAAGQMIDKTFNIGNEAFTDNGALAVKVDYKNQIPESDERNNQKHVTLYHAPLLPDLVIQSVEIVNDKAHVYVFNKCKGDSSQTYFSVIIYKGADKKSGWESSFGKEVPPLAAGTGMMFMMDPKEYPIMARSFSGRYVRVEVDETNQIKEAVETNNWWESGAAPFPDPANSCDAPK
jgi:hypothetical protein